MSFEQKLLLKKHIKTDLDRLKNALTCQVCFRLFREPQTLSCSHSYCKSCIKQLLQNSKEKGKFPCPQCRRLTSRREANHEDEMLAALVIKLHEFWSIMPQEIGCEALTQNTQYYDNYVVPKHMRASQLFSKHKNKLSNASSDSDESQNTQNTQNSNISNISNVSNIENIENEAPSTRRVTFNQEEDILIIDKEEEDEDKTNDDNYDHEPLYTDEDLQFLSQNRMRSPPTKQDTNNHNVMDIDVVDEDDTNINIINDESSIPSDPDLPDPMFSLDPDANDMTVAAYTLDFGMDSVMEHQQEEVDHDIHIKQNEQEEEAEHDIEIKQNEQETEVDIEIKQNEQEAEEDIDKQNEEEEAEDDIEIKLNEEKEEKEDIICITTNKNEGETIKPKANKAMLSVSTRSRRKKKKSKSATSHLLQSKSFMASQCSQIILDDIEDDDEDTIDQETISKPEEDAIIEDVHQDMDTLNIEMNDTDISMVYDPNTTPSTANTKPKKKRIRRKSISRRNSRYKSKKQKDQSKLSAIGLIRNDFVEGEFCSVCCADVDDIGVYCDGCNVFVHMQCCGILKKPKRKESWFCDPCKRDLNLMRDGGSAMACVICGTNTDCAYKAVKKSNEWAHISCALWITGCNFVNKDTLSPISIDDIDPDRYKLRCIFCKKRGGACLQCELCAYSFHVPCAMRGTAMLELREGDGDRMYFHSFCPLHTDDEWRKSVPDNNHDYPIYPKRKRKRKRNEDEIESKSAKQSKSKSPKKKRKKNGKSRSKSDCFDVEQTKPLFRSPDVRKRKLSHSAPVILCSKLTVNQMGDYDAFKDKFRNVATFTSQWRHNVTHLVTAATIEHDAGVLGARTIKYFESVIAGCWVMCFEWIEECLMKNTLIDESRYEVKGDTKGRGQCKKSRELRKKKHDDGLFSNVICVIASEFKYAKLDQDLRTIFRMGGAKILKMLPYQWLKDIDRYKKEMDGKKLVFVYDKGEYDMTQKQLDFCNKFAVLPIGYQQVFDAISNYKPISNRILNQS